MRQGGRALKSCWQPHEAAGGILDRPPAVPDDATGAYTPISEGPGTVIGPYKLLQKIGEGGFGAVYMAEQEKPVRRMVALKIIKPGMDTAQVIARFESERQALALMDHPNIATVLDERQPGRRARRCPRQALFRHGVCQRRTHHGVLRQESHAGRGPAEAFPRRLQRHPACASQGHNSPRHQAVERHGHAARWSAEWSKSSTSGWRRQPSRG